MASGHYSWLHSVPGMIHEVSEHYADTEKFIVAIALASVFGLVGSRAAKSLKGGSDVQAHLIPGKGYSFFNFFDAATEVFIKYHDSVLGKHGRRFMPVTAGIFFFILLSNLLGLVPGMASITTTVWVNVAVALVVFFYFNYLGIKEHGIGGYLAHFTVGTHKLYWLLALFIAPLIFLIEMVSTCMRVLTLNLRLFWNITADHLVLGAFTELAPWFVPVAFCGVGVFVCFIQAFVFTTLTMVYILLATQHEEEH